jgi:ubiquinone/menaquinone biosynthesis C-methylase UbiE
MLFSRVKGKIIPKRNKYVAEAKFWESTLSQYVAWYRGELKVLYGEKSPVKKNKVIAPTEQDSAVLTWEKMHQQPKYLQDLQLKPSAFKGLKLLDVGSGPHPSARAFQAKEIYCLDPLFSEYIKAGFPLHYYDNVRFISAKAESIPLTDHSIDAVISVNALDHVDNFEDTAIEIKRILKRNGKIRFHLHYHSATTEEPIELSDERILKAYSWVKNFHKISESTSKRGTKLKIRGEKYVIWSNF